MQVEHVQSCPEAFEAGFIPAAAQLNAKTGAGGRKQLLADPLFGVKSKVGNAEMGVALALLCGVAILT